MSDTAPYEIVAETFLSEHAMVGWLVGGNVEALKVDYPPPRYSARLDLFNKRVIVTDHYAKAMQGAEDES